MPDLEAALGWLAGSQGGHLAANPLQTQALMPSTKAALLAPSRSLAGKAFRGWKFGKEWLCTAPELFGRTAPAQLPNSSCLPGARRCSRCTNCLSPPFNKEMLHAHSSQIGNCRIPQTSDFLSQLTRKSDSTHTHTLMPATIIPMLNGARDASSTWSCELIPKGNTH